MSHFISRLPSHHLSRHLSYPPLPSPVSPPTSSSISSPSPISSPISHFPSYLLFHLLFQLPCSSSYFFSLPANYRSQMSLQTPLLLPKFSAHITKQQFLVHILFGYILVNSVSYICPASDGMCGASAFPAPTVPAVIPAGCHRGTKVVPCSMPAWYGGRTCGMAAWYGGRTGGMPVWYGGRTSGMPVWYGGHAVST